MYNDAIEINKDFLFELGFVIPKAIKNAYCQADRSHIFIGRKELKSKV